jgi:hypothetical protein
MDPIRPSTADLSHAQPYSAAGHDGGRITFEGAPAELIADGSTLTGKHLAEYVGN